MIEGMKLMIYRCVYGMFIYVGLMPVWNVIDAFTNAQITANNYTFCVGSIDYIKLGVSMIPFLISMSIGVAALHIYYRAVQERQYETQYQQGDVIARGYNGR
jgi:hypothetical protein